MLRLGFIFYEGTPSITIGSKVYSSKSQFYVDHFDPIPWFQEGELLSEIGNVLELSIGIIYVTFVSIPAETGSMSSLHYD